jgi:hypothetical protein
MEAQFRQRKNIIIGRTSDGFKRFLRQSLSFDLDKRKHAASRKMYRRCNTRRNEPEDSWQPFEQYLLVLDSRGSLATLLLGLVHDQQHNSFIQRN